MRKTKNFLSWALAISFIVALFIMLIDFIGIINSPSENTYRILVLSIFGTAVLINVIEILPKFKPPKKKLRIGLDVHGVCDTNPQFFAELSRLFINAGHEVIVITGRMESHGAIDEVKSLGISYTKFYSIADYHNSIGTKIWYDEKGNPWIDGDVWNKTKAEICEKEKIDFHIDDSSVYGNYFKTPYAQISIKN